MTGPPRVPAWRRIADDLRAQIRSGALPVGAQLPTAEQLRVMYGVSTVTIRTALIDLQRDGLVVGQQGRGVFVISSDVALPSGHPLDDARSAGVPLIMRRLDELFAAVRRLDQRMTELERTVAQERRPRGQARRGEPRP